MRKLMALILVCSMALCVLPAVAEVDFANPPAGAYITPDMYPNTDLSEFYDVQMFTTTTKSDDEDKVIEEINKVLKDRGFNTSITLNHIVTSNTANMYSLTLASGEVADIFFTAPWSYMWPEAAKGSWKVLNEEADWIEKYMPVTFKTQDPVSWKETSINGTIIAVPGNYMVSNAKYPIVRKDLMDKYGVEKISSWKDWMDFMLTIAEKETPASGIFGMNSSADNLEPWRCYIQQGNKYPIYNDMFFYTCQGSDKLPEFSEIQLYYETDLYRAFCHDMKTLADAGVWSKTALTNTVAIADSFANLTSASYFHNGTVFTYAERAEKNEGVKCEAYDLFPDAFCIPEAYSNNNLAIPESSANPERAAMIIDLMKNDFQIYSLVQYGIHGYHWNDNGDNTYTFTPERAKYNFGTISWALKVNWNYFPKSVTTIEVRRQAMYDEQNTRIVANPTVTFIFDDTNVKSEVAAVRAVADECRPQLNLGLAQDVDAYLDQFIKRMYDSGLQKIYDELNTQYTAWKAAQ